MKNEGVRCDDRIVELEPTEFVLAVVEIEPPEDPKPPGMRHRTRWIEITPRFENIDT